MIDIKALIDDLDNDFGYWIWTTQVVDEQTLSEREAALGIELPADYRAFVGAHGCAAVQAKPEVWPRPTAYAIGPQWAFDYGFEIFGLAKDVPPSLDLVARRAQLVQAGFHDLLPVARRMGRSGILACDAQGRFCWITRSSRDAVEGTFTSLIGELIDQLASDKERAKAAGASLWS
jgi:hypothetical protein